MATIWSVGTPQFSPQAFPGKLERGVIRYDVETAASNFWDGFQPGPYNPGNEQAELPFFISFELNEEPRDHYAVQIEYLVTKAGTCQLEAKLNDYRVLSFLDVVVPDNARELPNSYNMLSGKGSTQLLFPAKALQQGQNELVLKLVEINTPSEADLLQPHNPAHGDFFGYGLHYSVIEFKHFSSKPEFLEVEVVPTPFYKELSETGLCELLEARIHFVQPFETGVITISKEGQTFSHNFDPSGYDSGELRSLVAVPMPEAGSAVELKIKVALDTAIFEQTVTIQPCRQWTIHVMPHVHLDLGYTDFQGKVAEIHSRNIDRLLAITKTYPDYEFMVDGTWIIQNYLASRPERRVEAIAELARKGNLSIQSFYVLFLTGIISLEECYRAAYFAGELQEQEDFSEALTYANLTDVPTYSWAIPSVLAALGIPYFMGISNHVRAATADTRVLHKMSPVRWRGPDGAEVVAYFAHQYFQATLLFGDPPMVNRGIQNFSRFLAPYDRPDYLPRDLPLVGTHLDNLDLSGGYAGLVSRWNSEYAYPHLVFSSPPRYFAAIEKYKSQLPVVEGDGGSFWEDGVGAAAQAMAIYRKAQGLAIAAETFLALAAAIDPNLRVPRETLDDLWRHLIIGSEHTWTANHIADQPHSEQSTSQFFWKETIINEAARLGHEQLMIALSQLGERITTNGLTLLVFNPHSWPRTDTVEIDLPSNAYLLDITSGKKVEYDVVEILAPDVPDAKEQLRYSPALVPAVGANRVRFTAVAVPACGYRAYRVVNFSQDQQSSVQLAGKIIKSELSGSDSNVSTIETIYYRVKFDPTTGAVLSCLDKENDRELLDSNAPNHLGDYLYVQGAGTSQWKGRGSEVNAVIDTSADLAEPELTITPAKLRLVSVDKLQNGWCLRRSGSAPNTPSVSSDIYIYDNLKRIDVDVTFEKQPELAKEAVYIAFPFAFESPRLRYDRQQGWVEPAIDALPGSCNDWFAIQTAVSISDESCCVTWSSKDAPLFTAGDIVRGRWATNLDLRNGHLYSYVMNNYWFANYPASQEGEYHLHYSFTSSQTWSGVAAGRFGREVCQPLLRSFVTPQDKADSEVRPLPPDLTSLLKLEGSENITVAGIFGAQDNKGLIVRLQDIGQEGGLVTVRLLQSMSLGEVWLCSALERNQERISIDPGAKSFEVYVNSNTVITLRLVL